ncbi:MAG: TIGR02594 family protein [Flavobacteriales bacterium]|nr:TIGR02594 family protein [Flavobacteriales bacterium]
MIVAPWQAKARAEIGVKEIPGAEHNQAVIDYWKRGLVALEVNDDETPWCAAFVNAMLREVGIMGTRSGRARSFVPGPDFIACDDRAGAIVVLSSDRGAASGHVGFLEAVGPGVVHLLGGNQGNRVCIAPFKATRVVARLWPKQAEPFERYPRAPYKTASGANVTVSDR